MGTSINFKLVTPAPYQVRGKLRRESSYVKSLWIPVGVYPDGNRGRNDIFRGSLNCLTFKRQGGEYGNKKI